MKLGRTIGTGILGFFFMLFVGLDLVLFGVVPLNSAAVTILPVVGLVLGALLGFVAGRRRHARAMPGALPPAPPVTTFPPPHS